MSQQKVRIESFWGVSQFEENDIKWISSLRTNQQQRQFYYVYPGESKSDESLPYGLEI